MLSTNQMSNLEEAERDLKNKKLILDTAVDIQVVLQIMVEKGIVTREDVAKKREVVRNTQKYKNGYLYIQQAADEILMYKNDPQLLLKEMFRRKMEK